MKKRIDYIDTAKGFAIIAVVLSHALTNSNQVLNVDHPALLNFLSFFNVSTFLLFKCFGLKNMKLGHPGQREEPHAGQTNQLFSELPHSVSYNLLILA